MTQFDEQRALELLLRYEQPAAGAYESPNGQLLIGYSFNLRRPQARARIEALGLDFDAVCLGRQLLTAAQMRRLFADQIGDALVNARARVTDFDQLDFRRQLLVVETILQLGPHRFDAVYRAIGERDWQTASAELAASDWYDRVRSRATAALHMMEAGQQLGGSGPQPQPDVDTSFIATVEGNDLRANVPDPTGSQSGVTVGMGVDLGQMTAAQINALPVPQALRDQLLPYAGLRRQDAVDALARQPLTITQEDANALNDWAIGRAASQAQQRYDGAGAGTFTDLPQEVQTVLTSVTHQYGGGAPRFWTAVNAHDWNAALAELQDFGDRYQGRHDQEAALLQRAMQAGHLPGQQPQPPPAPPPGQR